MSVSPESLDQHGKSGLFSLTFSFLVLFSSFFLSIVLLSPCPLWPISRCHTFLLSSFLSRCPLSSLPLSPPPPSSLLSLCVSRSPQALSYRRSWGGDRRNLPRAPVTRGWSLLTKAALTDSLPVPHLLSFVLHWLCALCSQAAADHAEFVEIMRRRQEVFSSSP